MAKQRSRPERRADRAAGEPGEVEVVRRPKRRAHRKAQQGRDAKSEEQGRERPAAGCSRLASGQNGVVTHAQLRDAGLTPGVIKHLISAGILIRLHRGVYVVGHLALAPLAMEQAALFTCGPRAVISHRSAAYLWGLTDQRPSAVDVACTGSRRHQQKGLRRRHVARLSDSDVRNKRGIRLTSPARTIVDLAAEADDHELERLIAKAREKRLLRDGELEAALKRAVKRRGVARLRAFLDTEAGRAMTRSEVERRCRRLIEAAGLPQPRVNRRIAGYEVDFLWPEHRVVLEVDTITFHGHPRAFEWDRRKTLALEDAGYHVIRVTKRQLADEPYRVIAHIARALDRHARAAGVHTNVAVAAGGRA